MAEEGQGALTREQVVSLIGQHAKQLAELAQNHGFEMLSYYSQMAARRAERHLHALTFQSREHS